MPNVANTAGCNGFTLSKKKSRDARGDRDGNVIRNNIDNTPKCIVSVQQRCGPANDLQPLGCTWIDRVDMIDGGC